MSKKEVYKTHTKNLGSIGELRIATKLIENGYNVFTQLGDNSEIDLIAEKNGELKRIQVKTTEKIKNGVMKFTLVKSRMNSKCKYKEYYNNIDAFGLYCLENDYCGLLEFDSSIPREAVTIRLQPTKNNMKRCVRLAKDFEL